MNKKEMIIISASFLFLIALIILFYFYEERKLIASIILGVLFISIIIKLIFTHKKIERVERLDKLSFSKKFYIVTSLIAVFLGVISQNPNFTYILFFISIISFILLVITEISAKEKKSKIKYTLAFYLLLTIAIRLMFEREFFINKPLFYAFISIIGLITLSGVFYTINLNFKSINKSGEFKLSNETPVKDEIQKFDNIKNKTDIDNLYELLQREKSIRLSEITNNFGISKEKAEEWCRILEEGGLAIVHYPPIGEPELIWKNTQ